MTLLRLLGAADRCVKSKEPCEWGGVRCLQWSPSSAQLRSMRLLIMPHAAGWCAAMSAALQRPLYDARPPSDALLQSALQEHILWSSVGQASLAEFATGGQADAAAACEALAAKAIAAMQCRYHVLEKIIPFSRCACLLAGTCTLCKTHRLDTCSNNDATLICMAPSLNAVSHCCRQGSLPAGTHANKMAQSCQCCHRRRWRLPLHTSYLYSGGPRSMYVGSSTSNQL